MSTDTDSSCCGITFPLFHQALAAVKLRFARIKDRYPELKGYLVLYSPGGQTKSDSDVPEMVEEFPALFLDGPVKTEASRLAHELRLTKKQKEEAEIAQRPKLQQQIDALNAQFRDLSTKLIANGNCRIEIRFHHLDHALIWRLQTDGLVDRDLTPQTRASIRIVLGTLSRIAALPS